MKPRHEIKFIINKKTYMILKQRIASILVHDKNMNENGWYDIRSLYFDDYKKSGYFDKIDGYDKRKKYRARIYDLKSQTVKLEIKEKLDNLIRKTSSTISKESYLKLLTEGSISEKKKSNIDMEFEYKIKCGIIKPAVIIDYKREAFEYPFERTRITFDYDLKFSFTKEFDIFKSKIPMLSIFDEDYVVLEVKFDKRLASIVRDLIQINGCDRLAISKYALSQEKKGSLLWNN